MNELYEKSIALVEQIQDIATAKDILCEWCNVLFYPKHCSAHIHIKLGGTAVMALYAKDFAVYEVGELEAVYAEVVADMENLDSPVKREIAELEKKIAKLKEGLVE